MTVEVINASQFSDTMKRYAEVYSMRHLDKGLGEIVIGRALNLAIKLREATLKIAPNQAQIAADVQRQGWKIPEKFPDGRIGRGTPDQWAGAAVAALPKQRGRKSRARTAQEAAILGNKPTLQQMQAFVIRRRAGHSGFIASGWVGAIFDLGGHAKGGGFGRATVKDGGAEIDIVNNAPGCTEADAKHGFVVQGIANATQDMANYITERLFAMRKAA